MAKLKAPDCLFAKQGRPTCQVDLPKPNQLCSVCRPFWAKAKVRRVSKRGSGD